MKFLIDNALSSVVATELRKAGHDASHVRDHYLQAASDEQIFEFAAKRGLIVSSVSDALQKGCIVVIEETRIRIRSLPIGGQEDA